MDKLAKNGNFPYSSALFFFGNFGALHKNVKGKEIPVQTYYRACGFQKVEVPRFLDNRHKKLVRLSALHIGRLYPLRNAPGTCFCLGAESTPGARVRPEGPRQNSSDTKPATFRLIVQCLNQMRGQEVPRIKTYFHILSVLQ